MIAEVIFVMSLVVSAMVVGAFIIAWVIAP
jgi:hypothetical protein